MAIALEKGLGKEISATEAADLLGVSDQWIRDLGKKGAIPRPIKGRVPLVETVQGYLNWLRDEGRRNAATTSRSQVFDARAKELALRNAKTEESLIEAAELRAVFANIVAIFESELSSVPQEATNDSTLQKSIRALISTAIGQLGASFNSALDSYGRGEGFLVQ
jgi:phage terminase Nu1 subunit (DNA packaging protein)